MKNNQKQRESKHGEMHKDSIDIRLVPGWSLSEFKLRFKLRNVGRAEIIKNIIILTLFIIGTWYVMRNIKFDLILASCFQDGRHSLQISK